MKPIEQILEELKVPALAADEPHKKINEMALIIQNLEERVLALEHGERPEKHFYELEY